MPTVSVVPGNDRLTTQKQTLHDLLFLAGVVAALQGYFVRGLGFYSDDWSFLSILAGAKSHSIVGLVHSLLHYNSFVVRPIQAVELSVLYWLFGTAPLGYHIINSLTIISGIILFYLSLAKLSFQRIIAVGIPLVYALLPHYATTHFWAACFNANLSIAFYFLNLYAGLSYITSNRKPSIENTWLLICLVSTLACVLTYEVVLPLFFLNLFIFWLKSKKRIKSHLVIIGNACILLLGIVFKLAVSERIGGFYTSYTEHVLWVLKSVLTNDFSKYGFKLPLVMWRIAHDYFNPSLFIVGVCIFLILAVYLYAIHNKPIARRSYLALLVTGIVVYFGGYSVFLITSEFQVTSTGISNRVVVAAAIGIALCLFGGVGILCSYITSDKIRRATLVLLLSGLSSCGYIINCTIASFFESSYKQQLSILDTIYAQAPDLTEGDVFILDGTAPYTGPAPIFDTHWDLSGALALHYHYDIKADIRTHRLNYTQEGINTRIYSIHKFYSYTDKPLIYNYNTHKIYSLGNYQEANKYFTTISPLPRNYPMPLDGVGFSIF